MLYCEKCDEIKKEAKVINKIETFNVLGEDVEVDTQVMACEDCGEEIFNRELDEKTLQKAYEKYKIRHKLLLSDEIKDIRQSYGLSQRAFAKLLNWSDKTIRRYENGSIQNKSHNSLLKLLKDPQNMKDYLLNNETNLDSKQLNDLNESLNKLLEEKKERQEDILFDHIFDEEASIYSGFKKFDYDKLKDMVLFFANKEAKLLKTKLMKLLNYSDMIYFKEKSISISGLMYKHLPYGPVPDNYEIILSKLEKDGIINIEVKIEGIYESNQIIALKEYYPSLTNEELEILEKVYKKFKSFGSKEISDYSHKEEGYIKTSPHQAISYEYASLIDFDRN